MKLIIRDEMGEAVMVIRGDSNANCEATAKALNYDNEGYEWDYCEGNDAICEQIEADLLLEHEIRILQDMGLPDHCMTLDGDKVLNNRRDYTPTDAEREEFARRVKSSIATGLNK